MLRRVAVDSFPSAFSTTVPLAQIGTVHMPRQQVAGNLTFTAAANAVVGAYAKYPLIADGVSALTFSGFVENGNSIGYLNTAGVSNTLYFWYDGANYWWSGSQPTDTAVPTMASAAVANATPATVTLTASKALDANYVPAASAFTISGHTVLAVTGVSGTSVTLSVSAAFAGGEAAQTGAYTQPATNGLRDLSGNMMQSFTGLAITNNVQANASALTLTGPASGTVSVASTNFTVALSPTGSSYGGTDTVTPSDGGVGGTFSPATVTLTQAAPSATFTYTPSTTGIRTISVTNSSTTTTLTNPAGISYTSNAAAAETLTINTIASPQNVNGTFTVSGTWTNVQPANLDYRLSDDAAGVWTQVVATINTNGTWSFSQTPSTTSTGRTLSVRDRTNTSITATSNSYVVNAAVAYPRLDPTTLSTTVTETTVSPYTYKGTTGQTISTEKGGITTTSLAAGAAGEIVFQIVDVGDGGLEVGWRTVQSPNVYTSQTGSTSVFYTSGTSVGTVPGAYRQSGNGTAMALAPAAGDQLKAKRDTAGNYTWQVMRSGGTWQDLFTAAGGSTAQVWADIAPFGTCQVKLISTTGFA